MAYPRYPRTADPRFTQPRSSPDVSVFSRDLPIEQVFTRPQWIAVEVL